MKNTGFSDVLLYETESLIALAVEGPHESRWKDGLDSLNNSPNRLNTFRQLQEDVSVRTSDGLWLAGGP